MSTTDALLLGLPESLVQARRVAESAGLAFDAVEAHDFPDGESRLTLPEQSAGHVILYRSLDRPNPKLVELLLASRALRERGANRLTLVAPYLCYMRQDRAFRPGEVVSQGIIGAWLAGLFDTVVTVDPHLHRVHRLEQAVPARRAIALGAGPVFAEYLVGEGRMENTLLLGPDGESEQWVSGIARLAGLPWAVARKERRGDRSVEIRLPGEVSFAERRIVLLDDMASTGRTLAGAEEEAQRRGAAEVSVLITHALFVNDSLRQLRAGPIFRIGSSDSIPHETNVVSLAPLLGACLRELLESGDGG